MKALQIQSQGGLEVLEMRELPVPSDKDLGPSQILVKVEWAGVNFIDTYLRSGLYKKDTPFVLGNEPAGTVVKVGSGVESVKVGDKVASYLAAGGGFAEYAVVEEKGTTVLKEGVDTKAGAALILQGLTAWTLCREAYEVKKGDWILVHAAAGGVGLLLCQVSRASLLGALIAWD